MRRQGAPSETITRLISHRDETRKTSPLSLRERVRVRGRCQRPLAIPPHPNPLPGGEGAAHSRSFSLRISGAFLLASALIASSARAADTDRALADRAVGILRQYCYRCHGQEFK